LASVGLQVVDTGVSMSSLTFWYMFVVALAQAELR